jgi:phosphatidylglycerol---prolipoprotein diacylglyceryl transferase
MGDLAIPFPEWLSPILFSLGPFQIGDVTLGPFPLRWYALAYIGGIALGWWYLAKLLKTQRLWSVSGAGPAPMSTLQLDDYVLYATLGVILGGRLGFVFFYRPELLVDPVSVLRVWEGGMSFHGGLIGVTLATLAFGLSQKIALLRLGDAVACATPFGMLFGRLANFINGELWGRTSDVPWAVIFPAAGPEPRHPSQLYQAGLEGLALAVILAFLVWRGRTLARPGLTCGAFLLLMGAFRIFGEQFRQPDAFLPNYPFGLSMGMMLSAPLVIAGAILIAYALRRPPVAG